MPMAFYRAVDDINIGFNELADKLDDGEFTEDEYNEVLNLAKELIHQEV